MISKWTLLSSELFNLSWQDTLFLKLNFQTGYSCTVYSTALCIVCRLYNTRLCMYRDRNYCVDMDNLDHHAWFRYQMWALLKVKINA